MPHEHLSFKRPSWLTTVSLGIQIGYVRHRLFAALQNAARFKGADRFDTRRGWLRHEAQAAAITTGNQPKYEPHPIDSISCEGLPPRAPRLKAVDIYLDILHLLDNMARSIPRSAT